MQKYKKMLSLLFKFLFMNLLYISEDYLNSKVHHQLCNALVDNDKNTNVTLFCVRRSGATFKDLTSLFIHQNYTPVVEQLKDSHFLYKYWFPYKARKKWDLLLRNIDFSHIDYIHAATLFSEGIIAFKAHIYFGIPYSVAVRGSDLNFYFRKMPHLWKLGRDIIRHAQKVVFISPAQEKMACLLSPLEKVIEDIRKKKVVIPNGVDPFWIEHRGNKNKDEPHKFLYIGRFDSNKNVERLIDAFLMVQKLIPDVELHLVGVGGDREKNVLEKVAANQEKIKYHGPIYDPFELQKIYELSDLFTMISHSETFGLVFIEALSQGLPVLYTKDQGVDGTFSNSSIGIPVDSFNTEEVAQGMIHLIEHYSHYTEEVKRVPIGQFQWNAIANQYIQIFNNEKNSMISEEEPADDLPFISVICPVYNEKNYIRPCIESVLESDYPKSKMELYFVDGMSPDGTTAIILEYAAKYPFIKLLKNPKKTVPFALNIGIDKAVGTLVVRLDAHAFYPKNYFSELVKWQGKLDAENVGGLCRTLPAKNSPTAKAIAEAVSSKFGMGNSYFRIGVSQIRKVDTVPFGCFKREIFEKIGFFDTELVRNQDDEFNGRIIKNGGSIYLLPHVVSDYYARDTISKTAKMFYQYGLFKPLVNKKLGAPATLRQFVPPVFVFGLIVGLLLCIISIYFLIPYGIVLLGYLITALDNGRKGSKKWSDRRVMFLMPIVYLVIHLSYGFGYWKGLLKTFFGKSFEAKINR
jgi:glycosyltransferase involved in cell wall biosynthesis